jgi:TolB-like protein/cytochrome c-type biogenesis protein CcmH/NrfG
VTHLGPFLRHFVSELKRRRVLRVAGAYAAAAFITAQVADIAFPALGLPGWSMTLVIVLLLLGFPFALIFSWIFDVTPEGLQRTQGLAAVAGDDAVPVAPAAPGRLFRSRVSGIAAAAGVVVLALAAGAFMMQGDSADVDGADVASDEVRELSIAVLPFANQSAEPGSEYFSDGLTEAIQIRLNRIDNLRVTSITSVMTYRGSTRRMQEIAAELGVDHVVEGSVRRVGDEVRISVRLVEAATDRTLWSDVLDRPFTDVLAVETEIAEQIAAGLRLRLSAAQRGRLARGGTGSSAAYDLFMKARQMRRDAWALDRTAARTTFYSVLTLLRQAVDTDPEYAEAWAELSGVYLHHLDLPRAAREDSARAMADRAIRIAPDLPDGYVALGRLFLGSRATYEDARQQFERALERNPNHVEALLAVADLARSELRLVEQARLLHRAARLEPTNPTPAGHLAEILWTLGDIEGSLDWDERWRKLQPADRDVAWAREGWLAEAHFELGNRPLAERHYRRFQELAPHEGPHWTAMRLHYLFENHEAAVRLAERWAGAVQDLPRVDGLVDGEAWGAWYSIGYALAAAGDTARGHDFLRRAEEAHRASRQQRCPEPPHCSNTPLARLYAYRGDADRAVEYLQYSISIAWVDEYPGSQLVQRWFRNVSGDPRYQRIMGDLTADLDRQRETVRREGIHRP